MKAQEIIIQKLSQVEWELKKDEETAHKYGYPEERKCELKNALEVIAEFKEYLVKQC
jgi:hypothetical protein